MRELDKAWVQDLLSQYVGAAGTGIGVGIVVKGSPAVLSSYGSADNLGEVPVTSQTGFRVASLTKMFTAAATMLLDQRGALSVSDCVSPYVSGLPGDWRRITLEQLLNHTSGLPNYTDLDEFRLFGPGPVEPRDLVELVASHPLRFAAGTRHSYSNTGYILLGLVVEQVSGHTLDHVLRQEIFAPLDMASSCLLRAGDGQCAVPSTLALGLRRTSSGATLAEQVHPSIPWAAGAVVSTVGDLLKWGEAIRTKALLRPDRWGRMLSPTPLAGGAAAEYGLGFRVTTYRGRRVVGHGGSLPGFHACFVVFPDDEAVVCALANDLDTPVEAIVRRLAGTTLGLPAPPRPAFTPREQDLDLLAGRYQGPEGAIHVTRQDESLVVSGLAEGRLKPYARDRFCTVEDDEVTVRFHTQPHGHPVALDLTIPLYRTFTARRAETE